MIEKMTIWLVGVAALCIFAAPAQAATYCHRDTQCPTGSTCVNHRCVLPRTSGPAAAADPNADRECGADRRCRIRRLARRNRARRQIAALYEEKRLKRLLAEHDKQEFESVVRRADPWTADMHILVSLGPGLQLGYAITPHIRVEASYHANTDYVSEQVNHVWIDGDHDFRAVWAGASYLLTESELAPYLQAAFGYQWGTMHQWGRGGSSKMSTAAHDLILGAGLDLQFDFGLHARLGGLYRYGIYSEAWVGVGKYDDQVRKAIDKGRSSFDMAIAFGWAF